MDVPTLRGKLQIPAVRQKLVARPRLSERINAGINSKLTLVSAPPGFGKTTLLGEWLRTCDRPGAWLSFDREDNDVARFFRYLVAALQRVDASIGQGALEMFQSQSPLIALALPSPPAFEDLLNDLLNDIFAVSVPFALVLDDYHLIQNETIHHILALLLAHQPPHMHLVISTRCDPPLPLPRMRVCGEVNEIRETDLRFDLAEATALFKTTLRLDLSSETVAMLESRTEGWIAGLHLAALSLGDAPGQESMLATLTGDDHYIADFLIAEVLHQQSAHIQEFLLRTSILQRFNASLCETLIADVEFPLSAQAAIEQIESRNLFIVPLDRKRQWYRYHHLFADLLQDCLARRSPAVIPELHRRASQWHESSGDYDQAAFHALAISDTERLIHLIEQFGSRLLNSGQIDTLLSWIQHIPETALINSPYCCVGCGWVYALSGQIETALKFVAAGEGALATYQPTYIPSEGRVVPPTEMRGDLNTVRAFCARLRGDTASALHYSRQALEDVSATDRIVRAVLALNLGLTYRENNDWQAADEAFAQVPDVLSDDESSYVVTTALALRGNIALEVGNLDQAGNFYRRVIELSRRPEQPTMYGSLCMGHLGLAEIHYLRCEVDPAAEHLDKVWDAISKAGLGQNVDQITMDAHLLQARIHRLAGDLIRAEACLAEVTAARHEQVFQRDNLLLVVARAGLYLKRGDTAAAAQVLGSLPNRDLNLADENDFLICLMQIRLCLARRDIPAAAGLLEQVAATLDSHDWLVFRLEVALLQAITFQGQNRPHQARQMLSSGLQLAESQGILAPFVDMGNPLKPLLHSFISEERQSQFAQKVLLAMDASSATPFSCELLTQREQQILRLLAAGLSSTEVAGELVIAVSTTRSYIKAIYRKLDAHNRTEALARGRRLGLLSSP